MRVRTGIVIGAAIAVGLLTTTLSVGAGAQSSGAESPGGSNLAIPKFYDPPSPLPKGAHGTLIRSERVQAPKGAQAWRVLYLSQLQNGKPTAVSGLVIAPKGKAPKAGRPVVAWAHGTEGLGRNCAPSLAPDPAVDLVDYFTYESPYQQDVGVPALTQFLDAGYVVVATDYQGLGTPGVPEYTVLDAESRNVFDSVKAAKGIRAAAPSNDVVVLGWSQGGGASVWAGQNADYGAPLKVLGTAALAPAADTGPQFARLTPPGPANATSPFHAAALQLNVFAGFAAAYPELEPTDLLTPQGINALEGAGNQCINHFAYVLNSNLTDPSTLFALPNPLPADWATRFNENTAGYKTPTAPVLVMQGTADTVVNPNGTAQYVQRACGFKEPVQFSIYQGATHQTIPSEAQSEYVQWIADRFAGDPAPTNCGTTPATPG